MSNISHVWLIFLLCFIDILPILCSGAGSALGDNKKIEIAIPNKSSKRLIWYGTHPFCREEGSGKTLACF